MANKYDDIRHTAHSNPVVRITIQEKGDVGFDKQLGIPDDEVIIFLPIERAFILKGAMSSGKASVTIYAKTKDGVHVAFETSGRILRGIANIIEQIDGKGL